MMKTWAEPAGSLRPPQSEQPSLAWWLLGKLQAGVAETKAQQPAV